MTATCVHLIVRKCIAFPASWVSTVLPCSYIAHHDREAHGTDHCQGNTPEISGTARYSLQIRGVRGVRGEGVGGGGEDQTRKCTHGKMQPLVCIMCMENTGGTNKQWLWQSIWRLHNYVQQAVVPAVGRPAGTVRSSLDTATTVEGCRITPGGLPHYSWKKQLSHVIKPAAPLQVK